MSRIGKEKVVLPAGVTFEIDDNNAVVVKGPKGEIKFTFDKNMKLTVDGNFITVERPDDSIQNKALHGTTRALLHNMVGGVNEGFKKTLLIEGVGYRASLQGNKLVVAAGYSHLVEMEIPTGIKVECPTQTQIDITGYDKQLVGEFAANVRKIRKPEPYKGKGIRYSDEVIRRKEGKKAK